MPQRPVATLTAVRVRGPLAGRVAPEGVGDLAHLPVAVGTGPIECRFDLVALERRKGCRSAPAHRRAVVERGEHRAEAAWVADRAECGDGGLPTACVAVRRRDRAESLDAGRPRGTGLAEGDRRADDHHLVGVLEAAGDVVEDFAGRHRVARLQLARPTPHLGCGVAERGATAGLVVEAATSGGAEGARTHSWVRVGQCPEDDRIPSGAGLLEASQHGATLDARYRVVIAAHVRSEARHRLVGALLVVAIVLIAGVIVSNTIRTDQWAITPGLSQPIGPLIGIHGRHSVDRRSIYMTDVYLQQLTAWQLFVDWVHPEHVEFVNTKELTGGNTPVAQLTDQAYLQMFDSQSAAKAAAFRVLGLRVGATPAGARITEVLTGSAASNVLQVGDAIVRAGRSPVTSACGLVRALHGDRPGQTVAFGVVPATISPSGSFSFGAARTVHVRLSKLPPGLGAGPYPCGQPTAWLGVGIEDAVDWRFPVNVAINTSNIGGPSAGLAMTLGIIDALSSRPVTGGLRVAATGTMSPDGSVGDVGGVAEKTIAVENAGATVFFVPQVELGVAKGAASRSLRVYGVTTLAQALADLRRLGGAAPSLLADTSPHHSTS